MILRIVLLVAAAALALFPLVGDNYHMQFLTRIMIVAIFAMSLDLLVGYTGLVSLGHAAFFGVGAYTLWWFSPKYEAASLWLSLPAAIAIAAAVALVIGLFVLRTSGVYFIMATLAFAQMLYSFIAESPLFGGYDGVYVQSRPTVAPVPFDLDRTKNFYWLVLALMVATYLGLRMVLGSLFGKVIVGIRANERRMRALGYNIFHYKLASFVIAGGIAGLSGYLFAAKDGFVNPEFLGWHRSGDVLMMVILGGMGSLFGPIVGAFALEVLAELFKDLTKHWLFLMGGFIVLAVLVLPNGIGGLLRRE